MDIPQLATILSSTFDPNLREEAEKKLNEVKINCKLMIHVRDHEGYAQSLYLQSTF